MHYYWCKPSFDVEVFYRSLVVEEIRVELLERSPILRETENKLICRHVKKVFFFSFALLLNYLGKTTCRDDLSHRLLPKVICQITFSLISFRFLLFYRKTDNRFSLVTTSAKPDRDSKPLLQAMKMKHRQHCMESVVKIIYIKPFSYPTAVATGSVENSDMKTWQANLWSSGCFVINAKNLETTSSKEKKKNRRE